MLGLAQGWFTETVWWGTIAAAGCGVIVIGFLHDLWVKTKALWASSAAHKVGGMLIGAVITLPCYLAAHHAVNRITGLAPESFPFSLTLLAIGYGPLVVLVAGVVIFGAYSVWQLLAIVLHSARTQLRLWPSLLLKGEFPLVEKDAALFHFARLVAAVTLWLGFGALAEVHQQAEATLERLRTEVVVHADYYAHSPCRNVTGAARVAFLKDGTISVATRELRGWRFGVRRCERE
jgi:hypothetical protein